jgi:hypothetical protein
MTSPVFNDFLHPGVLPLHIKEMYIEKLSNIDPQLFTIANSKDLISTCVAMLAEDRNFAYDRFLNFTRVFDNAVGTDLRSAYLEFRL